MDVVPLPVILADIDALLAHIYTLATKLALAPDSSLSDLDQRTSALTHATHLLHDDLHGATLAKEVRNRVSDIIDALRTLTRSPDHLRTGTVHHLIESARSDIPKDNQTAVYRAWKCDRDSLDDNLDEAARIIQDDTPSDPDDGWDEIGLGNATNLDKDELALAKNVHQVLRLTTLLHKRIFLDLLSYPSSAPLSAFDAILSQSNLLLSTSDDLVAALYSPQDPDHVRKETAQLANIVTCLYTQTAVFFPTTTDPSKKGADKKWFDTCVHHILGLCSKLSSN